MKTQELLGHGFIILAILSIAIGCGLTNLPFGIALGGVLFGIYGCFLIGRSYEA